MSERLKKISEKLRRGGGAKVVVVVKAEDLRTHKFGKTKVMPDTGLDGKIGIEKSPVTPGWADKVPDAIQEVRQQEINEAYEKSISGDSASKERQKKEKKKTKSESQGIEFG